MSSKKVITLSLADCSSRHNCNCNGTLNTFGTRIQDYTSNREFGDDSVLITVQADESLLVLIKYASSFTQVGFCFMCRKSQRYEE